MSVTVNDISSTFLQMSTRRVFAGRDAVDEPTLAELEPPRNRSPFYELILSIVRDAPLLEVK